MYESKTEPPLPRAHCAKRMVLHVAAAFGLLLGSLGLGVFGYSYFEGLSVVDAFLDSALLLGGMGPVNAPVTPGGKVFAAPHALRAGRGFIVAAAMTVTPVAPVAHRVLHKFHCDEAS